MKADQKLKAGEEPRQHKDSKGTEEDKVLQRGRQHQQHSGNDGGDANKEAEVDGRRKRGADELRRPGGSAEAALQALPSDDHRGNPRRGLRSISASIRKQKEEDFQEQGVEEAGKLHA